MVAAHLVASARMTFAELHGIVVSAGLMDRTVKVRVGGQTFNKTVRKHFNSPNQFLVHDPNNSLRTGDVVAITGGWKMSKHKRHVVQRIIKPAQIPMDERPPVPTQEERWADAIAKREAKSQRKAEAKASKIAEAAAPGMTKTSRRSAPKAPTSSTPETSIGDVD